MTMIHMAELPFYLVIGLAGLSAPIGIFAALYYNYRTFAIVRCIQYEYRMHGRKWPFWTNTKRMTAFVLDPASLLNEELELAHASKAQLIQHRQTLKSYMTRVFACMFGSFLLAIMLLLTIALLKR